MKRLNKKHDLINIQILDQSELKFPNMGLIKVHDAENKNALWLNTVKYNNRKNISKSIQSKKNNIEYFCKRNNIDLINVNTKNGYVEPLIKFFNSRLHRQ